MNKLTRIILLVVGIPIFTYMFLGQLGILKLYSNPTNANGPNLKLGSKMLVSNLVKPKIGDFVCFRFKDDEFGSYIKVNRLCALENDTLEIKNGIVYLNNSNFDKDLNLIHLYNVRMKAFEILKKEGFLNKDNSFGRTNEDLFLIFLEDNLARKYNLLDSKIIADKEKISEYIVQTFNKNWNKDNFGPLIIPKDKFFVLGDNRDNAIDSRHVGLIDKDKIVGVVVKKF